MGSKKYFAAAAIVSSQSCCGWRWPCLAGRSTASIMRRSMPGGRSAPAVPFLTQRRDLGQLRGQRAGDDRPGCARRGVPSGARRSSHAARLLLIVLGGRLMVEILKQSIGRPRPDLDLHAVTVHSLSFPSGHAANSMITFVAIALVLRARAAPRGGVDARHRGKSGGRCDPPLARRALAERCPRRMDFRSGLGGRLVADPWRFIA